MASKKPLRDWSTPEKGQVIDPLKLGKELWPDVQFYSKQQEIIYSVWDNDETFVQAGNMLGKDFVAGFLTLAFFLTRSPCRVVTTSADYAQLESVLWGEIRRFIATSRYPLEKEKGGPLIVNHLHIRRWDVQSKRPCGISYVIGRVASKGEGMLGHHVAEMGDDVPRTFFIADEASGVEDVAYERADTWARRKLIIGNPYPCTNFFYRGCKAGDLRATHEDKNVDLSTVDPVLSNHDYNPDRNVIHWSNNHEKP